MPACLFVYGTLRGTLGYPLGLAIRSAARDLGLARLEGRLYDCGEYPGAVHELGCGSWIVGELYALDEASPLWAELDAYEGCGPGQSEPFEFERIPCPVATDQGATLEAWVYLYRWDLRGLPLIESGDYARPQA
jgi:gamma-glutamylcyclotransferase (GGCT)/AIG2-like uncharacterized protein YtfP